MSIFADLILWLFIESFLSFIFYVTGSLVFKVVTLGKYKCSLGTFSDFKAAKARHFNALWALGFAFYVILVYVMFLTTQG